MPLWPILPLPTRHSQQQRRPIHNHTVRTYLSTPFLYAGSEFVQADMRLELVWPLTCYGPDKEHYPPLNVIEGDMSPDEARLEFYMNQQHGVRIVAVCDDDRLPSGRDERVRLASADDGSTGKLSRLVDGSWTDWTARAVLRRLLLRLPCNPRRRRLVNKRQL
jgi:hypothetical protein